MRGSSPAGSSSVTTAVKAAVDRASSPGQGRDAGTAVPLTMEVVDMPPWSNIHISVKASVPCAPLTERRRGATAPSGDGER